MISKIFEDIFASRRRGHVLLEGLIDTFKFRCLFSEFTLDIARTKYVLKINPVLLHNKPVINDEHSVIDNLLQLFSLTSLSLEIPVAQYRTKVGQQLVELSV
jgi:hypothetical protein